MKTYTHDLFGYSTPSEIEQLLREKHNVTERFCVKTEITLVPKAELPPVCKLCLNPLYRVSATFVDDLSEIYQ